ncbi:SAC3 domain-containing protein 1 isoform X1 [Aricia agestis]|uniref:SAC3 domain-containing protein 1 isoform X1 n=1 Tax=Aricia agestis TaxID=91739 RepID=UPI001C209504|nr:SAC3 domain-containing protein 1 isoform X1 [Aricia agestis]
MTELTKEEELSIKGTCMEFCPLEEVNMRTREKMVHVLEATDTGLKLIKCYNRSAADTNMANPHLLRPYPVLLKCIHYLMFEVSKRTDMKKWFVYDFIEDRLRSVRQDMTIQRLPPEQCVELLEPMIRFYVYYSYRLCECGPNEYDPVLNKKHLLECLKWFLSCCGTLDKTKEYSPLDNIALRIEQLDLSKQKLVIDRVLVESLYILSNLNDTHPLHRYLQLPESLRRVSALKLAYSIGVANYRGNFVRIMKLSKRLCPLSYAALCSHLPVSQKKAISTMCHAYNSKQLSVPISTFKKWLMFGDDDEAFSACKHYGLSVNNNSVIFNKAAYKDVEMPPRRRNYSAKIIQFKLEDVLTYTL